jgi:hypothetical protein
VALGKMLLLGGMENSPPSTAQSSNRFKVANNVMFNNKRQLTPRPSLAGFNTTDSIVRWTLFNQSPTGLFKLGLYSSGGLQRDAYIQGVGRIPRARDLGLDSASTTFTRNFSDQSFSINDVTYFLSGAATTYSFLYKYDGYEISAAGIDEPYMLPISTFDTSTVPAYVEGGSKNIRIVGHALDLQGNNISSDLIQYATEAANLEIKSMAFSPELKMFVGIALDGICYSYNGIDWDANVKINNRNFLGLSCVTYGVAFGKPTFVALATLPGASGGSVIYISYDGINWINVINGSTVGTGITGNNWTSVCFGNGTFVAVNSTSAAVLGQVIYSADGINWNISSSASVKSWQSVCFGQGNFVAVANSGTGQRAMFSSNNGVTWTSMTTPSDRLWMSVTYGGPSGVFCAVAMDGTVAQRVMTIPGNLIGSWTLRSASVASDWRSVTAGKVSNNPLLANDILIAVASSGLAAERIMTSTDNGVTWTSRNAGNIQDNFSVVWGIFTDNFNIPTSYFIAGGTSSDTDSGLKYADVTDLAAWTIPPSPQTHKIELSRSVADVNDFLYATDNSLYNESTNARNDPYFYGKCTYNVITNKFDLVITDGAGSWGIFDQGNDSIGGNYLIRVINYKDLVNKKTYSAFAYKVSTSLTTFEGDFLAFNEATLRWETLNGNAHSIASGLFTAARRFFTIWASPSPDGIYYFKGLISGATDNLIPYSPTVYLVDLRQQNFANKVIDVAKLPFAIAPQLGAWYLNNTKFSFNSIGTVDQEFLVALTNYQDLLLVATENQIYFSDTAFGGSLEMTSGLSSIVVGDSQKGKITAICGTKDYLIVSRERKVYMLAGNITTATIRVQEIQGIPVGAYSNSCLLEVDGNVICFTSVGCWVINASSATKISDRINLNFKSFLREYISEQPSEEADCLFFDMNQYPANAWTNPTAKKYITSAYDSYRSILVFTDSSTDHAGQSLVLNLSNTEWTTFNSYDEDNFETSAMAFIDGVMYVGTINDAVPNKRARTAIEDLTPATYTYDYANRFPPRLVTTWMTLSEPSLEKQILQVKLFGYIWGNLIIKHYQNWDIKNAITNTTYVSPGITSPNNYIFYHKQRLNSSKSMASAIEISMEPDGNIFWIEGMEVEYEFIQAGMKR